MSGEGEVDYKLEYEKLIAEKEEAKRQGVEKSLQGILSDKGKLDEKVFNEVCKDFDSKSLSGFIDILKTVTPKMVGRIPYNNGTSYTPRRIERLTFEKAKNN